MMDAGGNILRGGVKSRNQVSQIASLQATSPAPSFWNFAAPKIAVRGTSRSAEGLVYLLGQFSKSSLGLIFGSLPDRDKGDRDAP